MNEHDFDSDFLRFAPDEIDNETDEETEDGAGPGPARDISHLTSMTGGFRADGARVMGGVFRADDDDERMTTMEVDLGDFESGTGAGFGALDFMGNGNGIGGPGIPENGISMGGEEMTLVPLNLGLETRTKVENAV